MRKIIIAACLLLLPGCSLVMPVSTIDTSDPNVVKYKGPKTENAKLTKPDGTVVEFSRQGEPLLDKAVGIKALLSVKDD
jgi:hypothetical protein